MSGGKTFFVLLGLCVCCTFAQFDRSANEYPVEASPQQPLMKQVLFTTNDLESSKQAEKPKASIVVGIMSSPSHFQEREAVRSTWMQLQSLTDPKLNNLSIEEKQSMVIRFIIGDSWNTAIEPQLAREALKYHDIVRVPVVESYFNLTLKTGEFLKWAHNAYDFKWVMKCDDDSFVRVDLLIEALRELPSEKLYLGKMWTGTPVDRRVDQHTPWKQYHTFAAGAGYVLTPDLVSYIVRNYDGLFKYAMEDVAIGQWLSGLKVVYHDHKNFHSLPEGCDRDMIVQNPAPPAVMRETFFNSVRGVPCHAKPDPFDPSTKNVTDHVLLELGIAPVKEETKQNHPDLMQRAAVQNLIQVESDLDMDDGQIVPDPTDEGMSEQTMNGNLPSSNTVQDMNKPTKISESNMDLETEAAPSKMNAESMVDENLI